MADLKQAILMNEKDNVAIVLAQIRNGERGQVVFNKEIVVEVTALEDIETYHKIAIKPIQDGDIVYKYGEIIGKAVCSIGVGQHVHIDNIESVMVGNESQSV